MWRSRHIYPLVLSAQLFPSLSPFSETSRKGNKKKGKRERRNVSRHCCVLSGQSDDCGFSSFSRGGLHVMIQLRVGGQQTAWCSIVSLPKEMLRVYRESLCNFCSFLDVPLLLLLHAFSKDQGK